MKTKTIKINVTATDIKRGERVSCDNCPIAIATKRRVKGVYLDVSQAFINFYPSEEPSHHVATHPHVTDFIHRFDLGEKSKPFSFSCDIPATFLK